MMETTTNLLSKAAPVAMAAALAFLVSPVADALAEKAPLRVCAGAKENPYSMRNEEGFENRIAKTLGEAMNRKVEFVWEDKPAIYVVRDQLDKDNCDVVIGVDTGDPRVLSTTPYYRAPYVFVTRSDSPLEIAAFDSPDLAKADNVGYEPGGPAEVMMVKHGLFSKNFNYVKSLTNFKSSRNQYLRIDPALMVGNVASDKSDVAIAFAPSVARYVKESDGKLKMTAVPDNNFRTDGEPVLFHFDQSMGVRKDNEKLLEEIEAALKEAKPKIHDILVEEGIPVEEATKPPSGTKS
jgi:mxaJ protein